MKKFVVYIALLLTLSATAHAAAPPESVFERYSSLDGLPNNAISDMCHDSKGFIWICTWYGLSRFDGYIFKNYRTLPGDYSPLSHNRFLKITEDAAGYLWLTTYDHKLYRFDRNKEIFEDIPHSLNTYADKNYKIGSYLCATSGHTWVAINSTGLIRSAKPTEQVPLEIVSYFDNPAIGKHISLLHEDSVGNIWVVSENGLARIASEGGICKISLVNSKAKVTKIDEAGGYICFADGRLLRVLDKKTGVFDQIELAGEHDHITTIASSYDGKLLYAGTAKTGITTYNPADGSISRDSRSPGHVRKIEPDSRGTLWVTTERFGIDRYNPATKNYKHFEQKMNTVSYYIDTITKIVERGDRVWVKMNGVGFGYYDRETDNIEPFYNDPSKPGSRMSNGVTCFDVEENNVLWISTNSRGLERITVIDHKANIFVPQSTMNDLAAKEIRALMHDSHNNLWIANKSGELFCYNKARRLVHKYPDATSGKIGMIYAMKEDSEGNIWLGTKGDGIYKMERAGNGFRFTSFRHDSKNCNSINSNVIYSIEQDGEGRMWFGSYGGGLSMLESTDSESFITIRNSFPNYPSEHGTKVRFLHYTPEGKMLAATVEGLIIFNPSQSPENMKFRMVQKIPGDIHSLGNNDIIHILQDRNGLIWLSTFGGGLNLLKEYTSDGEPRFEIYSSEQGLSSNIVLAATEDRNGDIWLSTENGISRFDIQQRRFINYSRYDGIPPAMFNEATALTDSNGLVIFGSNNNVYALDPDKIKPAHEEYKLVFTNLDIRNEPVAVGDDSPLKTSVSEAREIRLPHDYSIFRIEYASLNFKMQPRLNYMFILEGFEKDWNVAKSVRSASYSNVPHGNYTFRVKCFADDDRNAAEEISIGITILPPWWKTPWAYVGYALLILLLAGIVLRILYTVLRLRNDVRVEQEMTELKLRFFTNISHELRTPLTLILGGVEDVRKGESLTPKGENSINLAYKNAKRMLNLINQLLDFRKIVNAKMKLKVRRVDIIPIAQGVVDDFREMATEHNIELLFAVSDKNIFVWVDPERIEWVIYNLLSNAFKFTPDGRKIELSISSREQDEWFTISVRDTGIGIAREKQEIIFERFSQVSGSVTPGMSGTGIGLHLCSEIVQMHHGEISVDSKPGEGSTFTVKLRRGNSHFSMEQIDFTYNTGAYSNAAEYMMSDIESDPSGKYRTSATPPEGAHKILLVEDNHELRTFLYNNLINYYKVVEAVDGVDAMDKIKQEQPDIIITDLMMPNMDGNQLTASVRADFSISHIPIIMLTAKPEAETRIEAMKYGADGYITKPFSIELLLARIDNLLNLRTKLFEKYSTSAAASPRVVDLSPTEIVVTDRDEEFIRNTMSWIDNNIENSELTIDQLASHLGMGRTTMYNKLKSLTGKSPVELIKEYRINKAMLLLRSGQFAVSEVAYKVGFSDPGYFSKCFKEQYKISPAEFLKRAGQERSEN